MHERHTHDSRRGKIEHQRFLSQGVLCPGLSRGIDTNRSSDEERPTGIGVQDQHRRVVHCGKLSSSRHRTGADHRQPERLAVGHGQDAVDRAHERQGIALLHRPEQQPIQRRTIQLMQRHRRQARRQVTLDRRLGTGLALGRQLFVAGHAVDVPSQQITDGLPVGGGGHRLRVGRAARQNGGQGGQHRLGVEVG